MSRWKKVISGLIVAVFFCTTYLLICPAITLDHETICGMEEHQHDDSCYEESRTLVCPLEEGDEHTHTDDCYSIERVLICDKTEHVHTEECYASTEDQTEENDTAAEANGDSTAAEETVEGKTPTETEEQWMQSFAQVVLTDDPAYNMAEIAKTQVNYSENTEDVITLANDVVKGFTRYGAWYGKTYEYADWNDLFVFWCMNYAGVDQQLIPNYRDSEMNFGKWVELLDQRQLIKSVYEYDPKAGDLVFIDQDDDNKQDGIIDAVGIISERTDDENGKPVSLKAVVGDRIDKASASADPSVLQQDKVVEITYAAGDPAIASYVMLNKQEVKDEEGVDPEASVTLSTTLEDGTVLILNGKEGDFPFPSEEITMTAVELGASEEMSADEESRSDNALHLISKSLGDEANQLAGVRLFDITLWHDGEEIEPTGTVELTISEAVTAEESEAVQSGDTAAESETYAVYHIDEDNQTAEDMQAETGENGELVFRTDHFSIYGVATLADISLLAYGAPSTVQTVDSRSDGITINLFDYSGGNQNSYNYNAANDVLDQWGNNFNSTTNQGINYNHALKFYGYGTQASPASNPTINNYSGDAKVAVQGIVQNKLGSDGYPALQWSQSQSSTESLSYLFDTNDNDYKKVYADVNHLFQQDSNGYYTYDSDENYAYYNKGTGNFTVYGGTYKVKNEDSAIGFFPFNDYDTRQTLVNPDGTYYNHHFGLTMDAKFMLPEGKKYNGEDMVFSFSGDDDVWVFIDGVLVLDIGGIHGQVDGEINFTTGVVTTSGAYNARGTSGNIGTSNTIDKIFTAAGKKWDNADFSEHEIKFFYMERGGCYSNCSLNFNLPIFQKKQLELEKKIEGTEDDTLKSKEYQFQLYLTKGQGDRNFEVYKGPASYSGGTRNGQSVQFSPDGTFSLKPGEKIIFPEMISLRKYYFKEVSLDNKEIEKVTVNGTDYTPSSATGGYEIETAPIPIKDQWVVTCTNVAPTIDLTVEKEWSDGYDAHNGGYVTYHIQRRHKGTTEDWTDINNGIGFFVGSNDNWKVTHNGLPKRDSAGEFEYKVVEDPVNNYYPSITTSTNGSATTFHIKNDKKPEEPKITVKKQWLNSDGFETSSFVDDIEVQLYRKYTIPAPASSHTVTFYAAAYTWDNASNKQVTTLVPIKDESGKEIKVLVADKGSISFASSLYTTRTPDVVYKKSGTGTLVETSGVTKVEGEWAVETPVYSCSGITSDVSIVVYYDGIWESEVGAVKLLVTNKTEPSQTGSQEGTTIEEPVGSKVTLNAANEWTYKWKASELPAENTLYKPYIYYVKEVTSVPGFVVSYEFKDAEGNVIEGVDGITEGTAVVKNTSPRSYELPNSGGVGTQWYTLSGLMLLISAAMMWSCKLRKRHGRRHR